MSKNMLSLKYIKQKKKEKGENVRANTNTIYTRVREIPNIQ
jgi:hypothetical protein